MMRLLTRLMCICAIPLALVVFALWMQLDRTMSHAEMHARSEEELYRLAEAMSGGPEAYADVLHLLPSSPHYSGLGIQFLLHASEHAAVLDLMKLYPSPDAERIRYNIAHYLAADGHTNILSLVQSPSIRAHVLRVIEKNKESIQQSSRPVPK